MIPNLVKEYFGDNPCDIEVPYSKVQGFIPDEAHDKDKYKKIAPKISQDEADHEELWKWKSAHCFVKKDFSDLDSEISKHPMGEVIKEKEKFLFIYPIKKVQ